jgi:hypothetical protein
MCLQENEPNRTTTKAIWGHKIQLNDQSRQDLNQGLVSSGGKTFLLLLFLCKMPGIFCGKKICRNFTELKCYCMPV